jgi:hypothetical protein
MLPSQRGFQTTLTSSYSERRSKDLSCVFQRVRCSLWLSAAELYCNISFNRADYSARFPEALRDIGKWISEGRIIRKYHIVEGLESAPESLPLLFTGGNTGKLSVPSFLRPSALLCQLIVFLGSCASPALRRNSEWSAHCAVEVIFSVTKQRCVLFTS